MIDFTQCPINRFKGYGGANGNKINIIYNDVSYMLKFPPIPKRNAQMSYSNSCISEYLGCHIFEMLGFNVQKTLLGNYTDKRGKTKTVVACKDFTYDGKRLMEFAHLKNTCINSEQNGYGTELTSIINAIDEQTLIDSKAFKEFFWDMFVTDAFLGNFDRHNGNWGILIDEKSQCAEISPIYDCGSCLYPQLDDRMMEYVLNSEDEINQRIYTFPTSAIREDNQKINYFDYISSLKNEDCNFSLEKIAKRINLDEINEFIDKIPMITQMQKDFYKIILFERKEKIIDYSMNLLLQHKQEQKQQENISQNFYM